jgi:hypothetical protein
MLVIHFDITDSTGVFVCKLFPVCLKVLAEFTKLCLVFTILK